MKENRGRNSKFKIMLKKIIVIHKDKLERIPPVLSDMIILHKLGYELVLIDTGVNESMKKILSDINVKVYEIDSNHRNQFERFLRLFQFRKQTKKILRQEVNNQNSTALWVEGNVTFLALGKLLLHYNFFMQISELYEIKFYWLKAIGRIINKANIVFMPEYNRAAIYRVWFNLDKMPVVLPNKPYFGLDYESFDNLSLKYEKLINQLLGKKVILYQGMISKNRHLETYVKSIEKLGPDYALLLIGRGDVNYANELTEGKQSVYYFGFIPAPDYLLFTRMAHIGILSYDPTSLNNIFCAPNKIWEYSKFGLPMIGNDIPGLKYTIYSYGAGICADLDSVDAVVRAVQRIEDNYQEFHARSLSFFDSCDNVKIIDEALSNH